MTKKTKERYTEKQVADALEESLGSRVGAARLLKCTTSTLWNYMQRYPALKEIVNQADEDTTDEAINSLRQMIRDGSNLGAVAFWLKTRAGWSEKQTIEAKVDSKVEVSQAPPRAETLADWKARRQTVQEALD